MNKGYGRMQNVINMQRRGFLTEGQLLAAAKFKRNPNAFVIAPTFYRVLYDVIINDEPLEVMEKRRGWPARSAKALVGLCLFALQEMGATHQEEDEEQTKATEQLEYVTGQDDGAVLALVEGYKLTWREARLFLILQRSAGNVVSKETIIRRLYANVSVDEVPDTKIVDVFVCKIRRKIEDSGYAIRTVWGEGYRLEEADAPAARTTVPPTEKEYEWYAAHVYNEESLRSIARREGCHASTVMRAVNKINDNLDDEEIDRRCKKYAK